MVGHGDGDGDACATIIPGDGIMMPGIGCAMLAKLCPATDVVTLPPHPSGRAAGRGPLQAPHLWEFLPGTDIPADSAVCIPRPFEDSSDRLKPSSGMSVLLIARLTSSLRPSLTGMNLETSEPRKRSTAVASWKITKPKPRWLCEVGDFTFVASLYR